MTLVLLNTEVPSSGTADDLRARIAEILFLEFKEQQTFASVPSDFDVRVFEERDMPFQDFMSDVPKDARAFVNVQFQDVDYLGNEGTPFEQAGIHQITVDVAAFAQTQDTDTGHDPADRAASIRVQQVANYVYRFLMAPHNIYLQMQGAVGWRRIAKCMMYKPQVGGMALQGVQGARLVVEIKAPQSGTERNHEAFAGANMQIKRNPDGELYVELES